MSLSPMTLFRSRSSPKLNTPNHASSSSASSLTSSSSSFGSWSRGSVLGSNAKMMVTEETAKRTRQLMDTLERGLREYQSICESDIKNALTINMKVDAAREYASRVNEQLQHLSQLRETFGAHFKMRHGVRNLIAAYARAGGANKALNEARAAFRECNSVMGLCQRQLQSLMGWYYIRIEAIHGWARVCARDIYEIVITHAGERHKTRVNIARDGNHEWDSRDTLLKVGDDDIEVRVREVKRIGIGRRHVTLGIKRIPSDPIVSGHPQLMTLSGNASGSVKVTIRFEWRPFIDIVNRSSNSLSIEHHEISISENASLNNHESTSVLSQLMTALEDVQGQCPEVTLLYEQVKRLWRMRDDEVDAALAEFRFLTDEDAESRDGGESHDNQWDLSAETHMRDAITQLEHIGSWGLKSRERDAVLRIKDDAEALEMLMNGDVFNHMDTRAKHVWDTIIKGSKKLCVPWKYAVKSVERIIVENDNEIRWKLSELFITDIATDGDYVTAMMVNAFWKKLDSRVTFESIIRKLDNEYRVTRAKNANELQTALNVFGSYVPSKRIVFFLTQIIVGIDDGMCCAARKWLKNSYENHGDELTETLLSGLESDTIETRLGCCRVISFLHITSAVDALLHVATDQSECESVREEARVGLLMFDSDVQNRYHQCALSSRGFSGIFVQ